VTVLLALLFLVGGTALLLWGADWFIDGVRDLARAFGLSTFVLAILLVGLEPEEMLTAAIASAQGAGSLALGDIIGTNVTIMTLALGIAVLISPITLSRALRRQALWAGGISLPAFILLLLGPIERLAGLALLMIYGAYIYFLWRTDRRAMARMLVADEADAEKTQPLGSSQAAPVRPAVNARLILTTLVGFVAMAAGGPLIVSGALSFTQAIGLGQETIGGTIVALGTGAEMFALGITAARKGHADILVGGILGSFAYNLLVTMGLAALINPLPALSSLMQPALWLMFVVFLALLGLVWRGKIGRIAGGIGVGLYVIYLIVMIGTGVLGSFSL
jgi:cation:H+ antiporter